LFDNIQNGTLNCRTFSGLIVLIFVGLYDNHLTLKLFKLTIKIFSGTVDLDKNNVEVAGNIIQKPLFEFFKPSPNTSLSELFPVTRNR
jgi:hypothetical protein